MLLKGMLPWGIELDPLARRQLAVGSIAANCFGVLLCVALVALLAFKALVALCNCGAGCKSTVCG